jgi:hypothetical protein
VNERAWESDWGCNCRCRRGLVALINKVASLLKRFLNARSATVLSLKVAGYDELEGDGKGLPLSIDGHVKQREGPLTGPLTFSLERGRSQHLLSVKLCPLPSGRKAR